MTTEILCYGRENAAGGSRVESGRLSRPDEAYEVQSCIYEWRRRGSMVQWMWEYTILVKSAEYSELPITYM